MVSPCTLKSLAKELHGRKLDDNIISSILHILEEWILYFIIKNVSKFEYESMQPKYFSFYKHSL